jgi:hypothetical protein
MAATITGSPFGTFSMIFFLHHIGCILYFRFFWDYCETNLKIIIRGYFKKFHQLNTIHKNFVSTKGQITSISPLLHQLQNKNSFVTARRFDLDVNELQNIF